MKFRTRKREEIKDEEFRIRNYK